MNRYKKNSVDSSEVDMTPMLDIVFILLIFFIVTTSFIKERGVTIDRPSLDKKDTNIDLKPVVVSINDLEDVNFAGRLISRESVQANVEMALSNNPKAIIMVKVHETAGTGILVDVVDQVKRAGISTVTVSRLITSR